MPDVTLTLALQTENPIDNETINKAFSDAMAGNFDKFKFDNANSQQFGCRVKTKMFNPIVSLKGTITNHITGNKAKLMVNASVTVNAWFWFTILMSFLFWPLFIVDYIMYANQKKSSLESLQHALNQVEFNLGDISKSNSKNDRDPSDSRNCPFCRN